jgi:hypothetical protein
MSKVAKRPGVDPTLPRVPLTVNGETYFLCFTFGALALAQSKLIHALDLSTLDPSMVVPLLYASLITHSPDITIDEVSEMVTIRNLGVIFDGIATAYAASLAPPSDVKENPTQQPDQN